MRICIAGKNNIAVDALEHLLKFISPSDICVVVNSTENFKNTSLKSLGFFAKLWGVKILTLQEVYLIEDIHFISLEFDKIIKPDFFRSKNLFNIHFSLLPKYKGMYTSLLPILNMEEYSGVTLHKIDSGIDTGDVIDQIAFKIDKLTCRELYFTYMKEGFELFKKRIPQLLKKEFEYFPQSSHLGTYFGKKAFEFNSFVLDLNKTAYQIQSQIRALNFREYQLAKFNNSKIYKAIILNSKSSLKPGTIISETKESVILSTIDYNIELYIDYFDELLNYCKIGDQEKVEEIIDYIADLNEVDKNGWTPLVIACYYGRFEIVKLLESRGADLFYLNQNKTNLIMYAKEAFLTSNNPELINFLINKGVNINSKDIFGKNVFEYLSNDQLRNFKFN
jgi:methionyl-tRNA formyltransferase